jgi:predicted nucleic acid-binding protein
VASVDQTYLDPSALTALYIHERRSAALSKWRVKSSEPILVTHHGRTEVVNAICLASFYGSLTDADRARALSELASDFVNGELRHADLLWRAALKRAEELSQSHTPKLGTRALDVLHVACALELRLPYFLSFDQRQQKLAVATGLKLVKL